LHQEKLFVNFFSSRTKPKLNLPDNPRDLEERKTSIALRNTKKKMSDFEQLTPKQLEIYKKKLLNTVSASLIKEPRFDSNESVSGLIFELAQKISLYDGEFLLKLALYTRDDLGIRVTSNFLVSVVSNIPACQGFVRKYFKTICRLPSDWLDCAAIYQVLPNKALVGTALPTCLRKAMVDKFPDFDAYQLGKYNKENSIKRKNKKRRDAEAAGKQPKRPPPKGGRPPVTIKQMIRQLHIAEPAYNVMCILGKKYPVDDDSFRKSKLPGEFERERAGKRMKLPIAETWETMLSEKGNKASTWEELIEHKKLPFMAMLRNIRNLLFSGVNPRYHRWVINKLKDENTIANSRQFPFRFFSAYEVIPLDLGAFKEQLEAQNKPAEMKDKDGKVIKRRPKKAVTPAVMPPAELFAQYREALDIAVKHATTHNVKPIRGSTLVLVNGSPDMNSDCATAKGMGKFKQTREIATLLGLMCKYVCEDCDFKVFGKRRGMKEYHTSVELIPGTILDNMAVVDRISSTTEPGAYFPLEFLEELLRTRTKLDNLIVFSNALVGPGSMDSWLNARGPHDTIANFLNKYRQEVNPDLLFVSVDLSGRGMGISDGTENPNNVMITGFSDSILRFIAERGDNNQLSYVENIDKVKSVKEVKSHGASMAPKFRFEWLERIYANKSEPEPDLPALALQHGEGKTWRTARVFISSTFLDMHGERDLLTRHVFPELREKLKRYRINLSEVDLRWGITEEEAQKGSSLGVCLEEVDRCRPFFVGFLGSRYGWTPATYAVPDVPKYDWLKQFPAQRSITELEFHHAALQDPQSARGGALFYFREDSVLDEIPREYRHLFASESDASRAKINSLRDAVREAGFKPFQYRASWKGVVEGKPMVGQLEALHKRLVDDLWRTIVSHFADSASEEQHISLSAEEAALAVERSYHESLLEAQAESFVGRVETLDRLVRFCEDGIPGCMAIVGEPGLGKTALVAKLAATLRSRNRHALVLPHFVGVAPGSADVRQVLARLCGELKLRFGLQQEVPSDYRGLQKALVEMLEHAVFQRRVVLIIDSLDSLDDDSSRAHALDWLPRSSGVKIVVTLTPGSKVHAAIQTRVAGAKNSRGGATVNYELPQLEVKERRELVRFVLGRYRKQLDERSTNDQMRLLLRKPDAGKPLYLVLACEELRVFGVFEQLTQRVKDLGGSIPRICEELLARLELDHGAEVISLVLGALACSRGGLLESELRGVLSVGLSRPDQITSSSWASLYHSLAASCLRPVGEQGSGTLDFFHAEMARAVRHKYVRLAGHGAKLHQLLATHLLGEADPSRSGLWDGSSRAISELPYHLISAKLWREVESVLSDLRFIEAKIAAGKIFDLLGDYSRAMDPAFTYQGRERIKDYALFLAANAHVLAHRPKLTYQQAANQPDSSAVAKSALRLWSEAGVRRDQPNPSRRAWIAHMNKPQHQDACRNTLTAHQEAVLACAFSPDGTRLVASSRDSTTKIYATDTGEELATLFGHSNWVVACAFSPDGRMLATASWDHTAKLWDAATLHELATMSSHKRQLSDVVFSPDSKLVATASWDCTVILWYCVGSDAGKPFSTIKAHNKPINSISFSPDGQRLATGSWDATIKLWSVTVTSGEACKELACLDGGHQKSITSVRFAPNDKHLLSTSLDGSVRLWDPRLGKQIAVLGTHAQPALGSAYSRDGQRVATSSIDGTVKFWDALLGSEISSHPLGLGYLSACSFSPDDERIACSTQDCHIILWDVVERKVLTRYVGHTRTIIEIAYSPTEGRFASASDDGTARIWEEVFGGENAGDVQALAVLSGHTAPVSSCAYSPNGTILATGSHDFSVRLWSSTGQPLAVMREHTNVVVSCHFAPNGRYLVTASRDASMKVWQIDGGREQAPKLISNMTGQLDWLNCCRFAPDSKRIVCSSWDFNLHLWSVRNGKKLNTFTGHTGSVQSCGFSADGNYIVSASFDCTLKVWDSRTGAELTTLIGHRERINGFAFAHDGRRVASVSDDGTLRLWDFLSGTEIATLLGHHGPVNATAIAQAAPSSGAGNANTSNNYLLATASDDSTVRLWDTAFSTEHTAHSDSIASTVFSPDGKHVATASSDGTVKLWNALTGELSKTFAHGGPVRALAFNASNKRLLSVGDSGIVKVWAISTRKLSATLETGETPMPLRCIAVSPDDNVIASAGWSCRMYLWSTQKAAIIATAQGHRDWIECIAFSADSKMIATGSRDNTVILWNSAGRMIGQLSGHTNWISSCQFSANGAVVLSSSWDGTVRLWDRQSSAVLTTLTTDSPLSHAYFAPNSRFVLSVGRDAVLRIWDSKKGRVKSEFVGFAPSSSLSVSSHAQLIATSDVLGNLQLLRFVVRRK
jgi:telomerase protein component 1